VPIKFDIYDFISSGTLNFSEIKYDHDNTENIYSIGLLTPRPNNPRNTRQVDIPLENRLSVLLSLNLISTILSHRGHWIFRKLYMFYCYRCIGRVILYICKQYCLALTYFHKYFFFIYFTNKWLLDFVLLSMCYHDNTENVYSIGLLTPRPNNPNFSEIIYVLLLQMYWTCHFIHL
jgi:hypothetical protein